MATGRTDRIKVTASELRPGDRGVHWLPGRRVTRVVPIGRNRVELHLAWGDKPAKPTRIEATRTFEVERINPALRHRAEARTTRGVVEVWDTEHPDSPVTPEDVRGLKWAMRCEHGTTVGRRTQKEALADVTDPRLWCDPCTQPTAKVGAGALMLPL